MKAKVEGARINRLEKVGKMNEVSGIMVGKKKKNKQMPDANCLYT